MTGQNFLLTFNFDDTISHDPNRKRNIKSETILRYSYQKVIEFACETVDWNYETLRPKYGQHQAAKSYPNRCRQVSTNFSTLIGHSPEQCDTSDLL